MVLVMVLWLLPIRPARSVATCDRLPTTSSSNEFFDARAEDTVWRFVTSESMSPEREASAVSTWFEVADDLADLGVERLHGRWTRWHRC